VLRRLPESLIRHEIFGEGGLRSGVAGSAGLMIPLPEVRALPDHAFPSPDPSPVEIS
jgi:hypothetical protein